MRKIVLIAPGWVTANGDESVLRQNLPGLARMAELGRLAKLSQPPKSDTPEALLLGMPPTQVRLAQGPLTVAALGADPPERSTHFHLSPMALEGDLLKEHGLELPPEQVDLVMSRAALLNTRTLTVVPGEGVDHGLVWEGLGDLGTTTPTDANEKAYLDCLPEGDNEPALRRFIDDSVNILGELEFNAERLDQGLPPINILWPWGQGVRTSVPNLSLMRGEPAEILSPSTRLAGLTRLAGYKHGDRQLLRRGLNASWETIANRALKGSTTLIWTPVFEQLREKNLLEEASWLSKQLDDWFVDPILNSAKETPTRFAVLAPNHKGEGLCMVYETRWNEGNYIPFDERALDEKISGMQLHEAVDAYLAP